MTDTRTSHTTDAAALPSRGYAVYVLAVLLIVYTFNFIDRIILGVLVPAIKAEFAFTDRQLGLLGGTAFAIFYTALGIPIGWLADRFNRVWIMTAALALWSAFTAACGAAQNFSHLFLTRLAVGVGEAGGVAPAYSLIADYFPPTSRARAIGVYSFGIPIGSAMGLLFGGYIVSHVSWRAAFVVVGLAGLALAPLLAFTVREPARGGLDTGAAKAASPGFAQVLRVLAGKPAFWGLSFGAACSSIVGYGFFFWLPSFFVRSYHLSLWQMSVYFGSITLVGGVAGIWCGGWLADRLGAIRKSAFAFIPAAALALCIPFYVFGALSSGASWMIAIFVIPAALSLVWLGPVISAIQH
ncbi:MAG: spinster family MFS transporter, partial [Steroidobacterales bacterium]